MLLALLPHHAAAWTDETTVTRSGVCVTLAASTVAAVDPIVAWTSSTGRFRMGTVAPDGSVGTRQNVGVTDGQDRCGAVAVDDAGNALLVWLRTDGTILARAKPAGGVFGTIDTVRPAGPEPTHVTLTLAANGTAVVSWAERDPDFLQDVKARRRSRGGRWTGIRMIDPEVAGGAHRVAMDAAGNAVFVWDWWDGSAYQVRGRAWSRTEGLGPTQTLSPAGAYASRARVTIADDGNAVVGWLLTETHATEPHVTYRVQTRAWSADGVLGPVEHVAPRAETTVILLELATGPTGRVTYVWAHMDRPLRTRTRDAAGIFDATRRVSGGVPGAAGVDLAVHADGSAVFGWIETLELGRARAFARRRLADGALGPVTELGDGEWRAPVAIDANGTAVVAYGPGPFFERPVYVRLEP